MKTKKRIVFNIIIIEKLCIKIDDENHVKVESIYLLTTHKKCHKMVEND